MSLRLSVRRKATRDTEVNTLVQRGEEDRILKCFCMIKDTDLREGLYVMTRGTVGCCLRGGSRNFLKGGLYTIVVTFNAKNNFIQLFLRKNKKKITKKFCPKGGLQPPSPLPWIRLWV